MKAKRVKPFKPLGDKVKSKNKNFDYLKIAQPIKK
jgi:hypothetical protein